jgi:hypothetical protein
MCQTASAPALTHTHTHSAAVRAESPGAHRLDRRRLGLGGRDRTAAERRAAGGGRRRRQRHWQRQVRGGLGGLDDGRNTAASQSLRIIVTTPQFQQSQTIWEFFTVFISRPHHRFALHSVPSRPRPSSLPTPAQH